MPYYVEETLKASDIVSAAPDLIPHLIYGEVMEGARKPLVFLQAVKEDTSLVGSAGTKISVPFMTQYTVSSAVKQESESTIDSSGYTATDLAFTDTDVTIGNEVYIATKLSRTLLENQPNIDWLRNGLRNMGASVAEKLDADIRDALIAACTSSGYTTTCASAGTFAYGDIVKGLAAMKVLHWFPDEGTPPMLFVPPTQAADILGSTTFTEPSRYTVGDVTRIAGNAEPLVAGCRVLETSGFATADPALALIVMPPTHRFGPSTILAWKRQMDVVTKPQEENARTMYITSMRYGIAVINSGAVRLLSNC